MSKYGPPKSVLIATVATAGFGCLWALYLYFSMPVSTERLAAMSECAKHEVVLGLATGQLRTAITRYTISVLEAQCKNGNAIQRDPPGSPDPASSQPATSPTKETA